ncbi:hypothetical protein ABK040_000196 [Willaertia magna]
MSKIEERENEGMTKHEKEDNQQEQLDDNKVEEQEDTFEVLDKQLIETIQTNYSSIAENVISQQKLHSGPKQLSTLLEQQEDEEMEEEEEILDEEDEEMEITNNNNLPSKQTLPISSTSQQRHTTTTIPLTFRNYHPTDYHLKRFRKRFYASLLPSNDIYDKKVKTTSTKYFSNPVEATEIILKDEISNLLEIAAKQQNLTPLDNLLIGNVVNNNTSVNNEEDNFLFEGMKINQDLKRHVFEPLSYLKKQTDIALQDILKAQLEEETSSEEEESSGEEEEE